MTDQIRISDSGELETVPTSWDGEPLYSPATVQEGLFSREAFEQMPGQLAIAWQPPCGSPRCALLEDCLGRNDCPCGIGDER